MTYATPDHMVARFSQDELMQLTDREGLGEINASVLAQALADADALINGYLRAAYTLPLAAVPVDLVRVACDLARFFLYDDRVTETVQKRRDEAIGWLKDVAAKRVSLGADSGGNPAAAPSGAVSFVAGQRVFSAGSLRDF